MLVQNYIHKKQNNIYKAKLRAEVKKIKQLVKEYTKYTDQELKITFAKTDDKLTIYALGYVAIERLLGLSLHDVQLIGALCLTDNKIAEMKTGEGKTVTSCLPALYMSKFGQVHVCTVNEYLANRDRNILEPVYSFFGVTSAMNFQSDSLPVKLESYEQNIVYGTANTFGFDYLTDNMTHRYEYYKCKQKRFFALIDEVDLVLIDEARTPLIIGQPDDSNPTYAQYIDSIVKKLKAEDYEVDLKHKTVNLTESGLAELKKHLPALYTDTSVTHFVHQALLANYYYKKDVDYTLVLQDGEWIVAIIDTFTGRLQPDRRFAKDLHQALEAKHNVKIQTETSTAATITLQNYFKMYEHLAGMSGTAHEEQEEFRSVYNLEVISIETNLPYRREDNYILATSMKDKLQKIYDTIIEYHEKEYPILVGTISVRESEIISEMLKEHKLKHVVLNAKQDADEAEIISHAGEKGAITISTNMAGRGTDIKAELPLVVIATQFNESSRIDNQLKGRTSRQGADGITYTFFCEEDEIFKRTNKTLRKMIFRSDVKMLATRLQKELESISYSSRQASLKYDNVIQRQRAAVYAKRFKILCAETLDELNELISEYDYTATNLENDKLVILSVIDKTWKQHIKAVDDLKEIIGWCAQSKNPFVFYQNEALKLYKNFNDDVKNALQYVK